MKDVKKKSEDAKVIQFPGSQKTKSENVAELQKPHASEAASSSFDFKKSLYSLASIVLIATAVNYVLPTSEKAVDPNMAMNSSGVHSRSLASVGDVGRTLRDPQFERTLAKKLSKMSSRDLASVGRTPTFEDRLRFEYLEGKYAVRMAAGKVKEIEFASFPDAPKYLNDRAEFLRSYEELMPVKFDTAKSASREVMPKKIHETYQLVQNDKVEAEVQFELDLYGRLLSMKVETLKQ